MSQADALLELFRANGNRLTLGQILGAWDRIGSKYTGRISDVRKMGYTINCKENKDRPTDNLYTLEEKMETYREPTGQMAMVLR